MSKPKKAYESCLAKVPIFKNLSAEEQSEIVDLINVLKVKKGEFIYSAGDSKNALYVVHEGKVKVSRVNKEGNEQVIRVLSSGEFMGERSLFSNEEANDYATSVEDCHLCVISAASLKEHMLKHPNTMFGVMKELSGRLEKAEALIEETNLLPVDERIATSLINLSGKDDIVVLPYSKGDWSSLLGMKQETLSRKLRFFKEKGYLRLKGQRTIYIINRPYFEKLSNQ
ncbi:MAG: Crp/Fnr family transcriptional regulator [Bacilli bacterium]|nr:Crp/Fnr family transcriptional regulator [Bacilli bacterium]